MLRLRRSHASAHRRENFTDAAQGSSVPLGSPRDRKINMIKILAAACLIVAVSPSLEASEVCVACQNPVVTYRCAIDRTSLDTRIKVSDQTERKVCEKVLAKFGPHGECKAIDTQPCKGTLKSLTLADYQRALADNSEQTYQPNVIEQAQQGMSKTWGGVSKTWGCVSSLFKDC